MAPKVKNPFTTWVLVAVRPVQCTTEQILFLYSNHPMSTLVGWYIGKAEFVAGETTSTTKMTEWESRRSQAARDGFLLLTCTTREMERAGKEDLVIQYQTFIDRVKDELMMKKNRISVKQYG
jgi:hypothetical protein